MTLYQIKESTKLKVKLPSGLVCEAVGNDDWWVFTPIKKDGTRDRRYIPWSGCMPEDAKPI